MSACLLHAVPDAVVMLDAGRIALVNARAEALFGRTQAELLGHSADALFLAPLSPAAPPSSALTARRWDGGEFPVEVSLAEVDSPAGPRTIALIRDRTERHDAEARATCNQRLESLGQ